MYTLLAVLISTSGRLWTQTGIPLKVATQNNWKFYKTTHDKKNIIACIKTKQKDD